MILGPVPGALPPPAERARCPPQPGAAWRRALLPHGSRDQSAWRLLARWTRRCVRRERGPQPHPRRPPVLDKAHRSRRFAVMPRMRKDTRNQHREALSAGRAADGPADVGEGQMRRVWDRPGSESHLAVCGCAGQRGGARPALPAATPHFAVAAPQGRGSAEIPQGYELEGLLPGAVNDTV